MSWPSGGHSKSGHGGLPGFGPGAPWPMAPALPPSNKTYRQTKHEQDKQAAANKRKEERRAMQAEERRRKEWVGPDLFGGVMKKGDASQENDVSRILGSYSADKVGNKDTGDVGLIGVDYAPPTPAPAREHIIGEEDEEENNQKPNIKKPPPPAPHSSRHHPSASLRPPSSQTKHSSHKDKSPSLHHPSKSSSWKGSMAPPQSPSVPVKPPHKPPHQMSSVPEASSRKSSKQKPSPLKIQSNEKKSSVSSKDIIEDDDAQLKSILAEMQQPLPSFSNSGLPTPLGIIETPRVDLDERGCNRNSRPVYPGGFGSWGRPITSPSPPKNPDPPSPPPPAVKLSPEPNPYQSPVAPPRIVTKDSSSEQDESTSGSDSDEKSDKDCSEDDDKDDEVHSGFSIGSMKQPIRTPPPSSSERSVNKTTTPSPRFPHPSPIGVMSPSPRATKSVSSQRSGAGSPILAFPDVPPLIGPLSPMMDAPVGSIMSPLRTKSQHSESEQEEPHKMPSANKVKTKHTPSNSSVPLSSDDELAIEEERRKKMEEDKHGRKRKRKKSSQSSKSVTGSGSERGKSRKNKQDDDSDSDIDTFSPVKSKLNKVHTGRSHSTSPLKRPHSKKTTGSAHTTPRPQSTTSTPVREKIHLTPTSSSKNSKTKSKSLLSESDEDDDVPDKSPHVSGNKQKNTILSKMFGGMGSKSGGGKGGKGGKDGKGRGKGGITVIPREVSNDIDDEPPIVSKSSPSVRRQSDKLSAAHSPSLGEKEKKSKPWSESSDRENHSSRANIPPKKALEDDLEISDDDSLSSPGISRHPFLPQPPNFKTDPVSGRPSYLVSLPISRLGRSVETLQNKFKLKSKKPVVKQECWITSGDERGGGQSSSSRKRKPSESPVNVKSDPDQIRSSDRTSSHRKSNERTHLESEVSGSRPESRKRDRDHSPEYDSDNFSKRIRSSPSRPDPINLDSAHASYLGQEPEPPPPDPSLLPPAHPTWPGPGMMLPPPYPPKRVYYSYFERRHQDEAFEDEEENVADEATRLKREADGEYNMNKKCIKYLQAIMKFIVCGSRNETMGDKISAYHFFMETMLITKFVIKQQLKTKSNQQDIDTRLVVLSLRAQSLLNLKLYKMKRHELKDYQKTIHDVLAKTEDDKSSSDQGQNRTEQMSTPSPAGSEGSNCSKSSDYYSSGENRLPGVLTPPTAPPICLSIPRNVIQNQYSFCSYLSQCHELWEQADLYVGKGMCEEFFIRLDQECGPLTLHSSLKDLVSYTRKGLEWIEHDRQSAGLLCGLPPAADTFR